MIELTEQQRQKLSTSGPFVIDPETREEYVLIRRAAYERLRAFVEDGTVLATGEQVDRIMADDDANDITLESYQSITGKGHP